MDKFECTDCGEVNPTFQDELSPTLCKVCACPHEFDHDQCMDCGFERDPGEAIDRAMDYMEDR